MFDFTDESVGFGEIYYGDIFRVKNNNSQGYIAGNGKNGITEGGAWVTQFVLKANDANTMFIGYKNIWRSSNVKASSTASVTWTKISNSLAGTNSNNFNFLESNIAQPNMLYAARGDAKLFKTSNANAATPIWTDLTSALPNTAQLVLLKPIQRIVILFIFLNPIKFINPPIRVHHGPILQVIFQVPPTLL